MFRSAMPAIIHRPIHFARIDNRTPRPRMRKNHRTSLTRKQKTTIGTRRKLIRRKWCVEIDQVDIIAKYVSGSQLSVAYLISLQTMQTLETKDKDILVRVHSKSRVLFHSHSLDSCSTSLCFSTCYCPALGINGRTCKIKEEKEKEKKTCEIVLSSHVIIRLLCSS